MSFKCQRESYLQRLCSRVLSCRAVEGKEGKYEVVLEDTVLFPEGGGQVGYLQVEMRESIFRTLFCSSYTA